MALIAGLNLRDQRTGKNAQIEVKPMTPTPKRAPQRFSNRACSDEILADMETLGYVRENRTNSWATSSPCRANCRKPLSCIVVSHRRGQVPPSGRDRTIDAGGGHRAAVTLTPQALYYMDRDELMHKLVMIEGRTGSGEADYSIRQLPETKVCARRCDQRPRSLGRSKRCASKFAGRFRTWRARRASTVHRKRQPLLCALRR